MDTIEAPAEEIWQNKYDEFDIASSSTELGTHDRAPEDELEPQRKPAGSDSSVPHGDAIFRKQLHPPYKRVEVQNNLKQNEGKIADLRMGYRSLVISFERLEKNRLLLKRFGRVVSRKRSTSAILAELQAYMNIRILTLIQTRINELAGIGSAMTEIGSRPGPDSLVEPDQSKTGGVAAFVSCLHREKSKSKLKYSDHDPQSSPQEQNVPQTVRRSRWHQDSWPRKRPASKELETSTLKYEAATFIIKPRVTENRELAGIPLQLVKERIRASLILDLNDILHSITFPALDRSVGAARNKNMRVKVEFEKNVFGALEFMYKNELITQTEMQSFFWMDSNLELVGRHLTHLFRWPSNAFLSYHTLIPDLEFIKEDWHTDHLHNCLQGLDSQTHLQVVYTTLRATIEALESACNSNNPRTPESVAIFEFFVHKDFLTTLLKHSRKPKDSTNEKPELDSGAERYSDIVKYFQTPPLPEHRAPRTRQVEFLINYYIIKFINNFDNHRFKACFKNGMEYEKFEKQLNLMRIGLQLHQLMNMHFDYGYFLAFPSSAKKAIPKQVSGENQEFIKQRCLSLSQSYQCLKMEIENLSTDDNNLMLWTSHDTVHDIIVFLTSVAIDLDNWEERKNKNLWLIDIDKHVDSKATAFYERQALFKHLSQNFQLSDWYQLQSMIGDKVFWYNYFKSKH